MAAASAKPSVDELGHDELAEQRVEPQPDAVGRPHGERRRDCDAHERADQLALVELPASGRSSR